MSADLFAGLDMGTAKHRPHGHPESVAARYVDLFRDKYGKIGKHSAKVAEVIGTIETGATIHAVSAAEWSAEHVIAHIADQIRPARLLFCTWSVSDSGVTRLGLALESGALAGLRAAVNWRVPWHTPNAMDILKNVCPAADLRLTSVHAKVYLLDSPTHKVTIITSANLTANPNIEAYVITEGAEIWTFHRNWLVPLIDGSNYFDQAAPKKRDKMRLRSLAEP